MIRKYIAVTHRNITPINISTDKAIGILKRLVLLFDRIAIVDLDKVLSHYPYWQPTRLLIDKGIMYDPNYPYYNETASLAEKDDTLKELWNIYAEKKEEYENYYRFEDLHTGSVPNHIDINKASDLYFQTQESLIRCISVAINQSADAVPVLPYFGRLSPLKTCKKHDVVEVVLKGLPIPDADTSWEQLFEFRSDPETEKIFLGLKTWISEVAHAKLPKNEVEEKLRWQLHQHKEHLKFHRMKINTGTFATLFAVAAEVAEHIGDWHFGQAFKALFSARKRKIELAEAELNVPHPELAYIIKAEEI